MRNCKEKEDLVFIKTFKFNMNKERFTYTERIIHIICMLTFECVIYTIDYYYLYYRFAQNIK